MSFSQCKSLKRCKEVANLMSETKTSNLYNYAGPCLSNIMSVCMMLYIIILIIRSLVGLSFS